MTLRARAALASICMLFACSFAAQAQAQARAVRVIYVENMSTLVSDAQLADALPAFQQALSVDFAGVWNTDASLVIVDAAAASLLPADAWTIQLVDTPDCAFCAGYHDIRAGVPYAMVGVLDAWPITFTHELFEMVADPYTDRWVKVQRRRFPFYMVEVGDPVEANALAYTRPSASGLPVMISDFVTPQWYRTGSKGPWDFAGHVKRPLQVLAEGYQVAWQAGRWLELCPNNKVCRRSFPHR